MNDKKTSCRTALGQNDRAKRWIALMVATTLIAVALCAGMVLKSGRTIQEETSRYLAEVSAQIASQINTSVQYSLTTLRAVSQNLAFFGGEQLKAGQYLDAVAERYPFTWIGVADQTGATRTPDGRKLDLSGQQAVQNALHGTEGVGATLCPGFAGEEGIIYAVPLRMEDGEQRALVAWSHPDSLFELLDMDSFGGEGFAHIIAANGNFILRSSNHNATLTNKNLFQGLVDYEVDEAMLEEMWVGMAKRADGQMSYKTRDRRKDMTLNYVPLQEGDWYLLSVVPSNVYEQQIGSFIRFALVINVAIIVLFLAQTLLIFWIYRNKNRQIAKIAFVDPITGGGTESQIRFDFQKKLKQGRPFSLVSMDIRKFKLINDTFGNEKGSQVLQYMHQVIQSQLHAGETVARITSDVFDCILDTVEEDELRARLQAVTQALNAYNLKNDMPYYLPIDCGVNRVYGSDVDIVTIRDRANSARKISKSINGQALCVCTFFKEEDRLRLLREKEMESRMGQALEQGEFVIYLQPKVALQTNEVVGAEALARWMDPVQGLIPPDTFIPFFEANQFILKLDMYVFEQVCRMLRRWREEGKTLLPVSVNLSRVHLRQTDFLDKFCEMCARYQVPPALLELELTESLVFENLEHLKRVVREIKARGFPCSMDDFGSGYSSMNVLKEVQMDTLKLDKEFFHQAENPRGDLVVESVVDLARRLGMRTVSEGVESRTQVAFLRSIGCDMVQGYVFSKPVPVAAFEALCFEPAGTPAKIL